MFIVLYSWRINPEKEEQFIEGWSEVTAYFRANWDSLGSRLHRGSNEVFYAYAQWKSEAQRENAFTNAIKLAGSNKMSEAIEERFEPIVLEKISDYLIFSEE